MSPTSDRTGIDWDAFRDARDRADALISPAVLALGAVTADVLRTERARLADVAARTGGDRFALIDDETRGALTTSTELIETAIDALTSALPMPGAVRALPPGGVVARATAVLSLAFGETGAPWEDVCLTNVCCHDTCTAVHALTAAGLLNPAPPTEVQ